MTTKQSGSVVYESEAHPQNVMFHSKLFKPFRA